MQALLASHFVNSATCTSLFTRRKTSASAETKPGKAPSNVDYVGKCPLYLSLSWTEYGQCGNRRV